MSSILICLLFGTFLSTAAGLRAALPLAMIGYAHTHKLFNFHLPEKIVGEIEKPFAVPFLIFLALIEIVIYFVPFIDLAAGVFGIFTTVFFGTLVMFISLYFINPQMNEVLAILLSMILGGGITFAVNIATLTIRSLVTASSIGLANPILSLIETVAAFILSFLGIILIGKI
jgi:hypothetical protein